MGKTIAVINQKGGVGKTTSAVNIAAAIAEGGKSVLLVDLDPQGNATSGLGIAPEQIGSTTYEVLIGEAQLVDAIVESHVKRLYVLPADKNLAGAEVELVQMLSRELKLREALKHAAYDYIFIDCPPSLGLLTINALSAADQVLIPVQAEYYALEGLGQLMGTIQAVQGHINPQLELLGVLLTMYDKRTSLSEQVAAELKQHFGDKLIRSVIPRNVRLAEAPSFGKTVYEHDKWSKGARAYKSVAKEIENRG